MNSFEIETNYNTNHNVGGPITGLQAIAHWLKEIAYQLAVMNERNADDKKSLNVALCATNDDIPVRIKT